MTRSAWSPNDAGTTNPRAILGPRKGLLIPTPTMRRAANAENRRFGGPITHPRIAAGALLPSAGRQEPVGPRPESPSPLRSMMHSCSRSFVKFFFNVDAEPAESHAPPLPVARRSSFARASSWSEDISPPLSLRVWRSSSSDAYDATASHAALKVRFEKTLRVSHPASPQGETKQGHPAEPVPASAYGGISNSLKDLKGRRLPPLARFAFPGQGSKVRFAVPERTVSDSLRPP
jgi:hypothetical protein